MKDVKKIEIQRKFYAEIERIVAQSSQFQTVSEYVNFVLKEMLFADNDSERTAAEDEVLKKRMRDLGYM